MSNNSNVPAVAVLMRREGKLVFLRRSGTGFQDGCYCPPAGHVEDGESFRDAAVREIQEETGLVVDKERLAHVHTQHTKTADDIRVHVFFEVGGWRGEPVNAELDKHDELAWWPENALPYAKMMPFVAKAMRDIAMDRPYGEFGWSSDNA